MNIHKLLTDFWNVPAIIAGLRKGVWIHQEDCAVKLMWKEMGLLDEYGLTDEGSKVVQCGNLFKYTFLAAFAQAQEDRPEKTPENYKLLRDGLGSYFEFAIAPRIKKILPFELPDGLRFLDFCGGSGHLSKYLVNSIGMAGMLVDRAKPVVESDGFRFLKADVVKHPESVIGIGNFDLVVASEIFHCKNRQTVRFWLNELFPKLVRENGAVLIIERVPTLEFKWRMEAFSDGGDNYEIQNLEADIGKTWKITSYEVIPEGSHWIAILQR